MKTRTVWKIVLTGAVVASAVGAVGCAARETPILMECGVGPDPLEDAKVMAFGVTKDAEACRAFYSGKLGLRVAQEDALAIMFDSGGRFIRIQKMPIHEPRPYTVLGWEVADMRAAVKRLVAAGVTFERYDWMTFQDAEGVATFPDGALVAWFKDPDGNVLSVAQFNR
jgi:catechol 2,3-dioxygenase-like lactoylglutathione lyase family enzyme